MRWPFFGGNGSRRVAPGSSAEQMAVTLGVPSDAEATGDGTLIAITKRLRTLLGGATAVAESNVGAAASITATLAGTAGKTTYITGFQITGGGATGASVVEATVTGTAGGTLRYKIPVPAGATAGITPLTVTFYPPHPASAANTAIVVTVPSLGAGNTAAGVAAQGFQA